MARIFYFTKDGAVYGVHPEPHEDNHKIRLPEGVTWIDVPEQPHEIAWPPGCSEQTSIVKNGNLHPHPTKVSKTKKDRLTDLLSAHGLTVADLKAELEKN